MSDDDRQGLRPTESARPGAASAPELGPSHIESALAECDALCEEMDTSLNTAFLGRIGASRAPSADEPIESLLATLREEAKERGDTMDELRAQARQLEALVHERQDELDQYEHAALRVPRAHIDVHEGLSLLLNEPAFRACLATPKSTLP
ncbi:hypothetical protein MCAP1_002542 [Malassezia caprae]|uniref:Uncharacterized protein n=1 Tax=Malassezia caprae TaxID=1381934 RepID=A0AAF0E9W4_9BASI|nr:hypothetical protein MCAP1_002542 [Malassezia caprae]